MKTIMFVLSLAGVSIAAEIALSLQPGVLGKRVVDQAVVAKHYVEKPLTVYSSPVVTKVYSAKPVPVATKQVVVSEKSEEQEEPKYIAIISQNSESLYDGSFKYNFESADGTSQEAFGSVDPNTHHQVMQGRFSYMAPDGTPIVATWTADDQGFHIEGAHLPTPPPMPEAIARSLEYIRTHPPSKEDEEEESKNEKK